MAASPMSEEVEGFGGAAVDKKTKQLLKELALIALVVIILYFVAFFWFFIVFKNATVIWG